MARVEAGEAEGPQLGAMSGAFGQAWADAAAADAGQRAPAADDSSKAPPAPPPPDPLELAAVAFLKSRASADGRRSRPEGGSYSSSEMRELVRWLEWKRDEGPKRRLRPFQYWRGRELFYLLLYSSLAILAFLAMVGVFAALAMEGQRTVSADSLNGLLRLPQEDGRVAGVGAAVHLHSFLDYPSLKVEDLRRVQDVVFKAHESFFFYRVASVSKLLDGSVQIGTEDGTLLTLTSARLTIEPPYEPARMLELSEIKVAGTNFATAGAFPVVAARLPT